jgi:hypothetical protein
MRQWNYFNLLLVSCIALVAISCVEPYSPPESSGEIDILVVDGFLDVNSGTVNVKLSKAVKLSGDEMPPPVFNAVIQLEDSENNVEFLQATTTPGLYSSGALTLDNSKQYRIRIKSGEKEYLSDFITPKSSPPIDSVSWVPSVDGVTINVNTHDDTEQSRYYIWTFQETYEYRSPFSSPFKVIEGEVFVRQPEEQTSICWRTINSTKILIGTSLRLSHDIIQNKAIQFIPKGDIKTSVQYSILVKQAVLSRQAYDFWENLQKSTEQLGGLFDPQPGQVVGNIHRSDGSNEPVLGYFDGGQVVEKRIFINYYDLPDYLHKPQFYPECTLDTLQIEDLPGFSPGLDLVGQIYDGPSLTGYTYASISCTDCRTKMGSTSKPSFWP